MTRNTKEDDPPIWLSLLQVVIALFWAIVHILGALLEWAAVTLRIYNERTINAKLDTDLDPEIERLSAIVQIRAAAATSFNKKAFSDLFGEYLSECNIVRTIRYRPLP